MSPPPTPEQAAGGGRGQERGPRLLVVAGFLGSGKTTLVLEIARRLVAASRRVAIIENEIGDVGVDGAALAAEGLQVRELFGGCVCCTLQVGLVDTLRELARTYHPDYVIVEPTGIAQPSDLTTTVAQYAEWVEDVRVLTLIDAERHEMLVEVIGPMLDGQVAAADVVAVTKVDTVDERRLAAVLAAVRADDATRPVVEVSAPVGLNVDELFEAVTR